MLDKRTMPIRTAEVDLGGQWEGWTITVRKSVPFGKLIDSLTVLENSDGQKSGEVIQAIFDLLDLLIVDWNYVDTEGNPIVVGRDGFASCDYELLMLTVRKAQEAVTTIPFQEGEISPNGSTPTECSDDLIPGT